MIRAAKRASKALAGLAAALFVSLSSARSASAQTPEESHLGLFTNFSGWEVATFGAVVAWDVSVFPFEKPLIAGTIGSTTAKTCSSCALGSPGAVDRAVSDALYRGPHAGKLLGGAPDVTGLVVAPIVTSLAYLADPIVQVARGGGRFGDGRGMFGSANTDHKLVAFLEAFGLAMGVNQTVKITTGRLRPYYALHRDQPGTLLPAPIDSDLSFFSGHTTASFTVASFVYRDFSDWLVLKLASRPSWAQILLGRVAPFVGLYGAATLVGVSRIVDQAHYFSDVGLGAAVGIAVGNGVYALHFDARGRPRSLWTGAMSASVTPFPGGIGVTGVF